MRREHNGEVKRGSDVSIIGPGARIDGILAQRVAEEDAELAGAGGRRTVLDRATAPLNRQAARRFLKESRRSVWANTAVLHRARDEHERAADLAAQALAIFEELGDELLAAYSARALAKARLRLGRFEQARPPLVDGLEVCRRRGDRWQVGRA